LYYLIVTSCKIFVTCNFVTNAQVLAELGASVATRWKNWVADFDIFLLASGVTDTKRQRALLLCQAGARVREIFKQLSDTGEDKDYDIAKAKLLAHFEPQKNRRYEVYRFRKAVQEPRETLDQFHTQLQTLAQTCEFASGQTSKSKNKELLEGTLRKSANVRCVIQIKF
jgi:hypothetical protein